jgi:hypothetical protein
MLLYVSLSAQCLISSFTSLWGGFDSVDFKLIEPCTMCVKKKSTEIPPPPTNQMEILNENEAAARKNLLFFYLVIKTHGFLLIFILWYPTKEELAA